MVTAILQRLLATVFILYAVAKLPDLHGFVVAVANYQIAPFNAAPWDQVLAYAVVAGEIVLGLALLFGRWVQGALLGTLALTLSFIVAICSVWARGIDIDCGCGGDVLKFEGYPSHLVVLSLMLTAIAYLIVDRAFPSPH